MRAVPTYCLAVFAVLACACGKGGADRADEPSDDDRAARERRRESLAAFDDGNKAVADRDYETALTHFRRAVDVEDGNHAAWYAMGRVFAETDRWRDAGTSFDKANALRGDPMYGMWAGIAAFELGDHERAAGLLDEALAANARLYRARDYLGRIHRAAGRPRAAAASWTQACRMAPRVSPSCLRLAELYLEWDDTARAMSVLDQAVQVVRDPDLLAPLHYQRGLTLEADERWAEAADAMSEALVIRPDFTGALARRALAYEAAGEHAKARTDAETLLATDAVVEPFTREALLSLLP